MPKPTTEHDLVIDIFDQIITFSYAYEWQKSKGDSIDKLIELWESINAHFKSEGSDLFAEESITSASMQTLIMLGYTAENDGWPEPINFDDVWLNKPNSIHDRYWKEKKHEGHFLLAMLATKVVKDLKSSLPDELKPYVTIEQVGATFKKNYNDMLKTFKDFDVPIHKGLFIDRIHKHFLKTYPNQANEFDEFDELINKYCDDVQRRFISNLQQNFIANSRIKFFTRAQNISLEIDKYYSWGLIAYCHINYEDLLTLYSIANVRGLVKDGQHEKNKCPINDENMSLKLDEVLDNNEIYRWFPFVKGTPAIRYIFDTSFDTILIDGNQLQNHLVLALPYDKPLPDFPGKLNDFQKFFVNCVENYLREYSSTARNESQIKSITNHLTLRKPYERLCLTNAGSVLRHICLLLCLQYERSGDYASKAKKCQALDIYELIINHGFRYSLESVESMRKTKNNEMLKVVKKLQKVYSENDMSKRTG